MVCTKGKCMPSNNRTERALVGRRLQAARKRAHISVEEAAKALGVQPVAIDRWERGASLPSLIEFKAVLQLYGVMACEVLFEANPFELSPEHASELAQRAKAFSPGLRSRIDFLLAFFARGREPVWKAGLQPVDR
jgi:transcriptional regulator with XRE-family HTH domain